MMQKEDEAAEEEEGEGRLIPAAVPLGLYTMVISCHYPLSMGCELSQHFSPRWIVPAGSGRVCFRRYCYQADLRLPGCSALSVSSDEMAVASRCVACGWRVSLV